MDAPCPNCRELYDVEKPYCPHCGFSAKTDYWSGIGLLLAALIPGAMATCSVTLVAQTYNVSKEQARYHFGDFIGAGFALMILPVSLLALSLIMQVSLSNRYRDRISLGSVAPALFIIFAFALGWMIFLIRQALGVYDPDEKVFCWLWAALSLLVCMQILLFVRKELRRGRKKETP